MACPASDRLTAYRARALPPDEQAELEQHVQTCSACGRLVAPRDSITADTQALGPAHRSPRAPVALLPRGTSLGRYVLLDVLGSGGMGVVYAAFDPELNRRVAIKLVRAELGRNELGRARMVREAQAMARLSHPNVVSVHDVGIADDGSLFIAIEFVEGGTLSDWLRKSPRSWRDVLAMFIAAGRGLAAAHRAGLIHRDFKPENVLVGADGRPRVTDFGLARADSADSVVEPTTGPESPSLSSSSDSLEIPLTHAGVVMGTPGYMSPEQCSSLPTDARSDQFSFCAALYRALYGERPFEGSTEDEVIVSTQLGRIRPAPRDTRVPAWVHKALLGGLSVAPSARFPSMDALLAVLLDDPSLRRRRWLTGAAGVAILAVVAALVQRTTTQRARMCRDGSEALAGVWDPTSKQQLQQAFVRSGAPDALDTWERTERIVDEYAHAWVAMRGEACEATRIRGAQSDQDLSLRMACLDRRLDGVKAFTNVFAAPDKALLNQAIKAARALRPLDGCADIAALRMPVRPPDDPATRSTVDALRTKLAQAMALRDAGRYQQALEVARPAAEAAQAIHYRPLEAEMLYWLGKIQSNLGQSSEAEQTHLRAFWAAEAGGHQEIAAMTSAALVGEIGYDLGRTDWRIWADLTRAVLEHLGGNRKIEGQLENEIGLSVSGSDLNEARRHFERTRELREATLGHDRPEVAMAYNNLGSNALRRGDFAGALNNLQQSLSIYEKVLGPNHPDLAYPVFNLGDALRATGRNEEARPYYERVQRILELSGVQSELLSTNRQSLCELELAEGHYELALRCLQELKPLLDKIVGDQHPAFTADFLMATGSALSHLGRHAEAIAAERRALQMRTVAYDAQSPLVAAAANALAAALLAAGQKPEALREYQRALAIWQKHDDPNQSEALAGLGEWYLDTGQPAEAARNLERALQIREQRLGKQHPDLAATLAKLGRAQLALAEPSVAVSTLERALQIAEPAHVPGALLAEVRFALAQALWLSGGSRTTARRLAVTARNDDEAARPARERARVDAWLTSHP